MKAKMQAMKIGEAENAAEETIINKRLSA